MGGSCLDLLIVVVVTLKNVCVYMYLCVCVCVFLYGALFLLGVSYRQAVQPDARRNV